MKKIFSPGWRFVYTPTAATATATNYYHSIINNNKILIEYVNTQVVTAS